MNRQEATLKLIGALAGIDENDPDLEERAAQLIELERRFPGFGQNVAQLVRSKIYQKFPINGDLLARAMQLCAIKSLEASGLSDLYTSDLYQMEIDGEERNWGQVKTYAPWCRETQHIFSKWLQSGKASDKKKVVTSARGNR